MIWAILLPRKYHPKPVERPQPRPKKELKPKDEEDKFEFPVKVLESLSRLK